MRFVGLMGVAVAVALTLGGCGTGDDRDQARAATQHFYDAIRSDDGGAACRVLSRSLVEAVESQTGRSCRGAVTRFQYDGGAIVRTAVYATGAKVDLRSGESAFLSRDADGWRLSAIGCKAAKGKPADRPFECEAQA